MKKNILIFSLLSFISLGLMAQSFTLSTKNATAQGPNNKFLIEAKSQFHNVSTDAADTLFEWRILDITKPTEWAFGMCDPNNCLTDLEEGAVGTFRMPIDGQGEFKGDFSPNNTGGVGTATIIISSVKFPDQSDTLNYSINAWATGVRDVNKVKEFSFYPNPVKDKLTIRYQTNQPIDIEIYNVLGNKVKTVTHAGFESEFSVSELKSGMYFLRFKSGSTFISKQLTVID